MKYASLLVQVEAFQLPSGDDTAAFHEWAREHNFINWTSAHHGMMDVTTNTGLVSAGEGDWIIKMPSGSFDVFTDQYFRESFQPADESNDVADAQNFRWLFSRMIDAIRHQRLGDAVGQDDAVIALMEQFEQRGMAGEITLDTVREIFKEVTA